MHRFRAGQSADQRADVLAQFLRQLVAGFKATAQNDEAHGGLALQFVVHADDRGFSYGFSWTQPLGAELLYRAQLKINDYEQDLSVAGQSFDGVDQRFVSFTMGLNYVF